ncbi:MAG: Mur ligase domain-containing protein [Nitrospirota bacterium]
MKIFFSGIGGSGVSAIAGFMADKGHSVSGSDRLFDGNPDHSLCKNLRANNILIVPQDGSGIDASLDMAVFSTAVEKDNPDFLRAKELRIPLKTRPEYLSELVSQYKTIAVAGTSGKSTISGMLAYLMQRLGMEPNFIGGGRVKQLKSGKNAGNYMTGNSGSLIIEACESDGTIVDYKPACSVISNLDLDHHSIEETAAMFLRLSDNTSGFIITGGDDMNLESHNIRGSRRFSIDTESEYHATDIEYHPFRTLFKVNGQKFGLSLPGRHNLYNALACIAILSELGVPAERISGILPDFSGIERRFDIHLNNGRHIVIDDYAHNPHKILSLMKTMQKISAKVCYIFQPHGYGPTRLMKKGYIGTFVDNLRDSDHLVLLPIYYAGGTASKDISSRDISDAVKSSGRSAGTVGDRDEVLNLPGKWECYVVFGARDDSLSDLAKSIAKRLT